MLLRIEEETGQRTIVARELVVKVMVSFAKGNESGNKMVSRRPSVIKRLLAQPMRKRVDAERGLLNKARTHYPSVHESSPPIAPAQTGDTHGEEPC
jgi:hypothetical protein